MNQLWLELRTPVGLLVNAPVDSIVAEDLDDWFGIRSGRSDLLAVLQPGLLSFRDSEGEAYVALAAGLLDLHQNRCRVCAREAVLARELSDIAELVDAFARGRAARQKAHSGAMLDLIREAERRLLEGLRA